MSKESKQKSKPAEQEEETIEADNAQIESDEKGMNVTIPKFSFKVPLWRSINRQTKLTVFGMAIPAYMLWLAWWFVFDVAPVAAVLSRLYDSEYGDAFREQLPSQVEFLATYGDNRGLLYIVIGIILFLAALLLARVSFGRWGLDLKLGEIRTMSFVYGVGEFFAWVITTKLILFAAEINISELASLLASVAPYLNQI